MKFLRLARHYASIVAPILVLVLASCALAQGKQAVEQTAETDATTAEREREKREAEALALLKQIAADSAQNAANTKPNPQPADPYAGWEAWSAAAQGFSALVVLFFTGLLVKYNLGLLKATKDTANAARDSANAVKAINRQWLDTSHFFLRPEVLLKSPVGGEPITNPAHLLHIEFIVTNNTPLPLTLEKVRCFVCGRLGTTWSNNPLQPAGRGRYRARASCFLTQEEDVAFTGDGLELIVAGWIDYIDNFGDPQSQPFGRGRRVSVHDGSKIWIPPFPGSMTTLLAFLQSQIDRTGENRQPKDQNQA